MRYVRFMGFKELEKYLNGETLVNNTVWRERAKCTDSVGFCFFDDSVAPEERIEYLTGVVDMDCVLVCERADGKQLRKSCGRYRDPSKDILTFDAMVMTNVPEYSTEQYSLETMKPVRIGVVMDPYYERSITWTNCNPKKWRETYGQA